MNNVNYRGHDFEILQETGFRVIVSRNGEALCSTRTYERRLFAAKQWVDLGSTRMCQTLTCEV